MPASTIILEVFSASACNRCLNAKIQIQVLLERLNVSLNKTNNAPLGCLICYLDVDVVENIDRAVELGILTTPTIVINDQIAFTNMPNMTELEDYLMNLLSANKSNKG